MRFDYYLSQHTHTLNWPRFTYLPSLLQPVIRYDETSTVIMCLCWMLGCYTVLAILMTILFSFPLFLIFFFAPFLSLSLYPLRTVEWTWHVLTTPHPRLRNNTNPLTSSSVRNCYISQLPFFFTYYTTHALGCRLSFFLFQRIIIPRSLIYHRRSTPTSDLHMTLAPLCATPSPAL